MLDILFMKKLIVLLILLISGYCSGMAQNHKPYFQQKVNTRIQVTLDDVAHILTGNVRHEYFNNSPDTLYAIYFHLYPNAYKNNHTAYAKQMLHNGNLGFARTPAEQKGYIDVLSSRVNGVSGRLQLTDEVDVVKLLLPQPLAPGSVCEIDMDFKVQIPFMTSRLGHVGQSYQITQWFPKPAVYDREGWHQFPYLNYGEFYSEFGDYVVDITLPDNYIVMATGNLQTPEEMSRMDSLSNLPESAFPSKNENISSSKKLKTIRFQEKNIHDFAWFADKNWIVRKDAFTLPENNTVVTAWAAFYLEDTAATGKSTDYIKEAVLGYSHYVGAYPYQTAKSVTGPISAGGGMEYPTITIIDAFGSSDLVREVIIHEVGHNWFYGILGSNERRYPFMDESINSYYEKIIVKGEEGIGAEHKVMEATTSIMAGTLAANNLCTPAGVHSEEYKELNYGIDIYERGAAYFKWLCAYMGADAFNEAMKDYYNNWKFKHPQPSDLQAILQKHTDKPIDWFFAEALQVPDMPDFTIKRQVVEANATTLILRNNSRRTAPAGILYTDTDNKEHMIWTSPFKGRYALTLPENQKVQTAQISGSVPDINPANNALKQPLGMGGFIGFNMHPGYKIYVAPSLGFNMYDKFMLGGLIHNITVPTKKIEYAFAPMYGMGSNQFVYTGYASYFWIINNTVLKDITLLFNSKKFSNNDFPVNRDFTTQYIKNKLGATFQFRPKNYSTYETQKLTVAFYNIAENTIGYSVDSNSNLYDIHKEAYQSQQYFSAQYTIDNPRPFYPYTLNFYTQAHKDFGLLSLDARYKINYRAHKKGVKFRLYAGKIIGENSVPAYGLLSLTQSGRFDYLYDHTFIGRTEQKGFWSNQSALNYGGFYTQTNQLANQIGISNNFIAAVNIDIQIPKTPLSVFGNLGYVGSSTYVERVGYDAIQYEAGLAIHVDKYFTLALPLLLSDNLREYRDSFLGKNSILKSVAFRFNISELLPSRNTVDKLLNKL